MTSQQALLKAADLIEKKGWCQGISIDKVCAFTAILEIDPACETNAIELLRSEIGNLDIGGYTSIASWNDHGLQTKESVLATMRRAAKRRQNETPAKNTS